MSDYVSKESLVSLSQRPRRYADAAIPGWGTIRVQSVTAAEFCRMDAARNRAILMASSGKLGQQTIALQDYFVEVAKAAVAEPQFTDADRPLLLSLDSSISESIKDACLKHCNIEEASVEGAEKNSQTTSGGSSPSSSGST